MWPKVLRVKALVRLALTFIVLNYTQFSYASYTQIGSKANISANIETRVMVQQQELPDAGDNKDAASDLGPIDYANCEQAQFNAYLFDAQKDNNPVDEIADWYKFGTFKRPYEVSIESEPGVAFTVSLGSTGLENPIKSETLKVSKEIVGAGDAVFLVVKPDNVDKTNKKQLYKIKICAPDFTDGQFEDNELKAMTTVNEFTNCSMRVVLKSTTLFKLDQDKLDSQGNQNPNYHNRTKDEDKYRISVVGSRIFTFFVFWDTPITNDITIDIDNNDPLIVDTNSDPKIFSAYNDSQQPLDLMLKINSPNQESELSSLKYHLEYCASNFRDSFEPNDDPNAITRDSDTIGITDCRQPGKYIKFPDPPVSLFTWDNNHSEIADIDYYKVRFTLPTGNQNIVYRLSPFYIKNTSIHPSIALLDEDKNPVIPQASSPSSADFSVSDTRVYYIEVKPEAGGEPHPFGSEYKIEICSIESDKPIATFTPSPTPTLTSVPTKVAPHQDDYENNDTAQLASRKSQGSIPQISPSDINQLVANFVSREQDKQDVDFYRLLQVVEKFSYKITTEVSPTVATKLTIYHERSESEGSIDDRLDPVSITKETPDGLGGQTMIFTAEFTDGYWIKVENSRQLINDGLESYYAIFAEILPPPTATPRVTAPPSLTPLPTGTPAPLPTRPVDNRPDKYEYNGTFELATLIGANGPPITANFALIDISKPGDLDNDFYVMAVHQGLTYTCETLKLSPGTDTNIIIYNQDRVGIGGNDNVPIDQTEETERFRSKFSWYSGYNGYAYILVGEVLPPLNPLRDGGLREYSLRCKFDVLPTATPPTPATPTPAPPFGQTATSTPVFRISQIYSIKQATPTPTVIPTTPAPIPEIRLRVRIFMDTDENFAWDANERGIADIPILISDGDNPSHILRQLYTDATGNTAEIRSRRRLKLQIPLLGFERDLAPGTDGESTITLMLQKPTNQRWPTVLLN